MMREREVAVRAFFFELREANHMVSGVEKSPRYVLLPSGIYANRVFLVGIMTGT
jgi:RPA family protein